MTAFTASTPAEIDMVRFVTLKGALKLETLGMSRRGMSAYAIVKQEFGYKGSKAAVLAAMQADYDRHVESHNLIANA
mgnify:CR=1 FL=1